MGYIYMHLICEQGGSLAVMVISAALTLVIYKDDLFSFYFFKVAYRSPHHTPPFCLLRYKSSMYIGKWIGYRLITGL